MTEEVATRLFTVYAWLLIPWGIGAWIFSAGFLGFCDSKLFLRSAIIWYLLAPLGLVHYLYWWVNYGGPPW